MTNFILLEDGSALLQEDGSNLLLDITLLSAQSTPIDFNNGLITTATLNATYSGADPTFYMSAIGSPFEQVTNGVPHIFAASGTDLQWKVEGEGTTITQLNITDYH